MQMSGKENNGVGMGGLSGTSKDIGRHASKGRVKGQSAGNGKKGKGKGKLTKNTENNQGVDVNACTPAS